MSKDLSKSPEMEYFMNEEMSDVVFVIEGQRLPANKFILSFKSKVFRAMFSDKFKESKDKEVVIEDTTFEAFKTLIQFFYSEQLVVKDPNDLKLIEEVLKLSDRYEAFRLSDKMAEHMNTICLKTENIGLISKIADKNKELNQKVVEFIDKRIDEFVNKDDHQLIEMNDSTHNYFLKVLANNYRKEKKESSNYSYELKYELNKFEARRCQHCDRIFIRKSGLKNSGYFKKCPNCDTKDFVNYNLK